MLLDVGTEPQKKSISDLVHLMDRHPRLGGAGGELQVESSMSSSILEHAQFYEYRSDHFIAKSFEAAFGYQSVLPGAFSILRWDAIKDEPAEVFFEGINSQNLSLKQLNSFLAEDRVMCFWIMIQRLVSNKKGYLLSYLPGAIAVTDVPKWFL